MNIDLQKLEKSEAKLTVELTADEMKEYEKKAAEELQDKVTVAGFRAGHIPFDVLKEHVGEQAFLSQVLDIAISESYTKAVREKELRPVDYPKVSILAPNPLKFEAIIPLRPEVKFKKDVKTLTVNRKKITVDKKEIEEVIKNFLERFKKWTEVDGPAKLGDRTEIDFDGFDMGGAALEGTSSKNHPVVLGSNSLIPGFEEEIVGMKKGEEKDFEITFPEDYHKESFKKKKVKFHVKLNMIEEGEARKADDAFAQEISGDPKKTIADLEKEIEEELSHQKEHDETARLENEFLKELMENTEAEVPEALIEKEIDFLVERLKEDLKRHHKTWEEYEEELKKEKKDIRKELAKPAKDQVLTRLGLEKLYETEDPEVTEKEIDEEVAHVLGHYPEHFRENVAKNYEKGAQGRAYLESSIKLKKIVKAHTQA